MLTERLQVLMDKERMDRLRATAKDRGVSVGQVIRDAVDQVISVQSPARRKAMERILGADPMPVPEPAELKRELQAQRGPDL